MEDPFETVNRRLPIIVLVAVLTLAFLAGYFTSRPKPLPQTLAPVAQEQTQKCFVVTDYTPGDELNSKKHLRRELSRRAYVAMVLEIAEYVRLEKQLNVRDCQTNKEINRFSI